MKQFIKKILFLSYTNFWFVLSMLKIWKQDNYTIRFVSENKYWSIYHDGLNITKNINLKQPNLMKLIFYPKYFRNNIVHFGSQYMWVDWYKYLNKKNKYVVSFFHGKHEDGPIVSKHIKSFLKSEPLLSAIITSSSIMKKRLIKWGIPKEKLFLIPIGVDSNVFYPINRNDKNKLRAKYEIEKNEIVIGSFQKDGQGWSDGDLPKLIKGPDIFVEVMSILKKQGYPIKIFLTGPARGYVKKALLKLNVPFIHEFVDNINDLNTRYHLLDLYLITSREEGGPKGLVESMASGIPVISTNVGMSYDFLENNHNGFVSYNNQPDELASYISKVINNKLIKEKFIKNSFLKVNDFKWENVAELHLKKVYLPLMLSK